MALGLLMLEREEREELRELRRQPPRIQRAAAAVAALERTLTVGSAATDNQRAPE